MATTHIEPLKTWTVPVEQDPEDPEQLMITLPPEMLEILGWQIGDRLLWRDNHDGSWSIAPTGFDRRIVLSAEQIKHLAMRCHLDTNISHVRILERSASGIGPSVTAEYCGTESTIKEDITDVSSW